MGSDMVFYARDVMERSHGGLQIALQQVRVKLITDDPVRWADLLKVIDTALNNARIG